MSSSRPCADLPPASDASSEVLTERVLEVLKDVVQRRTSARALSERLGHSHNYVRRILCGEITLQLETLLDMLGELGMPPRLFFDQVFDHLPATDPVAVLRFYREGDGLPPDPFLEEIEPRVRAAASRPTVEAEVESRRDRLDHLEEERFEDRDGAKEKLEALAREILDDVEACEGAVPELYLGDLALTFAIWATVHRVKGQTENARKMYMTAFELLRNQSPGEAHAEVYQRSAYLLAEVGAVKAGLYFLNRSLHLHTLAAATESIGRVMVDHGVLLGHLDEYGKAERYFIAALNLLPERSTRNRASAYSALSRCAQERGDLLTAFEYTERAFEAYGCRQDLVAAQILATKARLAFELDFVEDAEESFVRSIEMFDQTGNAAHVALVSLDYSKLLLSQGKMEALSCLADSMFTCLKAFRSNRIVDAALMEFIRTAKWGELTEALVAETKKRLLEAA